MAIVVSLAIGASLFISAFTADVTNSKNTTSNTDAIIESEPDSSDERVATIERAEAMHVEGNATPTDEQIARMEVMNAQTSDMDEQERQKLLEAMQ